MRLIVNADDFGYSRGINYGIVDCFQHGIVTSTTLMMNMPGTEHAVKLAKENPQLGVGVHLVLTCNKPILSNVASLVNEDGYFKSRGHVASFQEIDPMEIEKEWTAQIEKFLSTGLTPTHFDSHHFVHCNPNISPVIFQLAKKYDVPVRNDFQIEVPTYVRKTDIFIRKFHRENATIQTILDLLQYEGKTVELMCHPGYIDNTILQRSSYHIPRVTEVSVLTSEAVFRWKDEHDIKLITFTDL